MRPVACLLVVAAALAPALAALADDWARIREDASRVRTIQASFTQQKRMKILKKPLVSIGRFTYEAPGSVRWEYESPIRTLLLVRGGKVRRFVAPAGGEFVPDASSGVEGARVVMEQITGWLSGRFEESEMFAAALDPAEKPVVSLTPKEKGMKEFINRVVIRFSDRPGVVESVEIIEGGDTSTLIEFSGVRLNEPIREGVFDCEGK